MVGLVMNLRYLKMKVKLFRYYLFGIFIFVLSSSLCLGSNILEHSKSTVSGAFDTTGLYILGVGTLATAIAFNQDQVIHDAWKDHQRMSSDTANLGNFWGSGVPEVGIAIGQLIFDSENGVAATEGLISSTLLVQGLKFSTKRPRPDSETVTSFPSGHTQISFASATSLAWSYGWKAALPSYALGVLTGLSRLADNAHWLSDVITGATIGALFGRAGFSHHFNILPVVTLGETTTLGIVATWSL